MDFPEQYHSEDLRCDEKSISRKLSALTIAIVCLSRICLNGVNITSCQKSTMIFLDHACRLITDIIMCKYLMENLQFSDKISFHHKILSSSKIKMYSIQHYVIKFVSDLR